MPGDIYDNISEDNNELSCNSSSSSEIGNIDIDLSKFTVDISACARKAKPNYQLTMQTKSYVKLKKAKLRPKQVENDIQRPKKSFVFNANTWTHCRNKF